MSHPSHTDATPASGEISGLLFAARGGERAAVDCLFDKVYTELHALAHHQLACHGPGETLCTTALVHEAYLKLVDSRRAEFHDRRHFFALAARAMRQIIIDYARRAQAQKRGGGMVCIAVDPASVANRPPGGPDAAELVALDDALTALERLSERMAGIVELRFFAGLSVEETGAVLEVSPRTVKRDWRKARAFLFQAMGGAFSL